VDINQTPIVSLSSLPKVSRFEEALNRFHQSSFLRPGPQSPYLVVVRVLWASLSRGVSQIVATREMFSFPLLKNLLIKTRHSYSASCHCPSMGELGVSLLKIETTYILDVLIFRKSTHTNFDLVIGSEPMSVENRLSELSQWRAK